MIWIALAMTMAMAMTGTAVAKPKALKQAADNHAHNYYFMAPGKLYFYHAVKMTFADARTYCEEQKGDLASINSIADFKKIQAEIGRSAMELWVGAVYDGNADPGHWRWFTGEAFPTYGDGFKWHWPDSIPFTDAAGSTKAMFIHGDKNQAGFCKPAPQTEATRGALCQINQAQDGLDGMLETTTFIKTAEKLFFYHAEGMTFGDARTYCTERGGDLATLKTIAHFKKVNERIQGAGKELWVGAEFDDAAKRWRWFTGEEFPIYGEGYKWHHPDSKPFSNANGNVGGSDTAMFIHGDGDNGFCGPGKHSSTTRGALCEVVLKH